MVGTGVPHHGLGALSQTLTMLALGAPVSTARAIAGLDVVALPNSAVAIRDDLKQRIDANDGLFVAALAGSQAWINLKPGSDLYLTQRLGAA